MDTLSRQAVYARQNGATGFRTRLTPRQRRRIVKKRRHMAAKNDLFTNTLGGIRDWTG